MDFCFVTCPTCFESFEIAMPPDDARRLAAEAVAVTGTPFTVIGEVVAGAGLTARFDDGSTAPLIPRGYEHAFDQ